MIKGVCVRACVRAYVCVCVCVCVYKKSIKLINFLSYNSKNIIVKILTLFNDNVAIILLQSNITVLIKKNCIQEIDMTLYHLNRLVPPIIFYWYLSNIINQTNIELLIKKEKIGIDSYIYIYIYISVFFISVYRYMRHLQK